MPSIALREAGDLVMLLKKNGRTRPAGLGSLNVAGLSLLLLAGPFARAQYSDGLGSTIVIDRAVSESNLSSETAESAFSRDYDVDGFYRLGPGDEVTIEVIREEEIPRSPMPVGADGVILCRFSQNGRADAPR